MSRLINRQCRLESGAVYTVTGFDGRVGGFNIDFTGWRRNAMPHNQNKNFSLADLKEIARKVFPGIPAKRVRIRAHSGAGMNISLANNKDVEDVQE